MCIARNRETMIGSAVTRVRTEQMISRSTKRGSSRIGTRTIGSISRWITFKTDLTTQRTARNKFSGRTVWSLVGLTKRASCEREGESKFVRTPRYDEDDWIERVRSALLPFVEKGRRNYAAYAPSGHHYMVISASPSLPPSLPFFLSPSLVSQCVFFLPFSSLLVLLCSSSTQDSFCGLPLSLCVHLSRCALSSALSSVSLAR